MFRKHPTVAFYQKIKYDKIRFIINTKGAFEMKKRMAGLLTLIFVLTAFLPCAAVAEIAASVEEIAKYGNLILDQTGGALLAEGMDYGDLLSVKILDQEWEMPLGSNYSDVDTGLPVVRVEAEDAPVVLAINMGDLAAAAGIASKTKVEEDPGYRWDYLVEQPVQVVISLKEKEGYREQWLIHQLVRTNERGDYAHLDDEAFANFRMIDTTGVGENQLYRSSSPINPEIGRSVYADEAARKAGIKTIINLADASNTYEGTEGAYYQSCQTIFLNLGVDFADPAFKAGLAEGLRFLIANEAPYLVHCNEGKDRAGFTSALLECLMGASADEVVDDYMETYVNYYGLEKGTEKYDAVVNSNIVKTLAAAFDAEDIFAADLAAEAEVFVMEELGLSQDEVNALKAKLGK